MAQRHQRGWLKKEMRSQGETWVLFYRTTRKSDGKRVESKIPIVLVKDFPEKSHAWAEVVRLHLPINQVNSRRGITFGDATLRRTGTRRSHGIDPCKGTHDRAELRTNTPQSTAT